MSELLGPDMTAALKRDLVDMVATGLYEYPDEYTKELFPDYRLPHIQDLIADGFAEAIRRYEVKNQRPLSRAIALALLENKQ